MSFIINPAEIAEALEKTARDLAADVEEGEPLVAQARSPGITDTFKKLKHRAELVGMAAVYFRELANRPETPLAAEDFPKVFPVVRAPPAPEGGGTSSIEVRPAKVADAKSAIAKCCVCGRELSGFLAAQVNAT